MSQQFQQLASALSNQNVKQVITDIVGGCGKQTATVISFSLAKLYFAAKSQQFQDGGMEGLLTILIDRKEWNCYYLRIYHPSSLEILFSVELCYGINELWQIDTKYPNFCILPISKGFIGFLFPNSDEAKKISNQIQSIGPKYEDLAKENFRIKEEEKIKQKEEKEIEKAKSFFGKLTGSKNKQIERSSISYAQNCGLIFNIHNGEINIKDMHNDLVTLFKNAKIFRKDLCDINTAKEIFKAIASYNEIIVKSAQVSPQKKSVKQSSGNPSPASTKEEVIFNFPARLRAPLTISNDPLILELPMRNPNKPFDSVVDRGKVENNTKINIFIEQTTGQIFGKKKQKRDFREIVKEEIEKFTGLQVQNKCEFILDLSQLQKTDFAQLTNVMLIEIQRIRIQQLEKLKQSQQQKYQNDQVY